MPSFMEAHQVLKIFCNVRSLNSQKKTCSFLEEIITLSNKVFNDFESDMAVWLSKLGDPTQETAKSNHAVKQTSGS